MKIQDINALKSIFKMAADAILDFILKIFPHWFSVYRSLRRYSVKFQPKVMKVHDLAIFWISETCYNVWSRNLSNGEFIYNTLHCIYFYLEGVTQSAMPSEVIHWHTRPCTVDLLTTLNITAVERALKHNLYNITVHNIFLNTSITVRCSLNFKNIFLRAVECKTRKLLV